MAKKKISKNWKWIPKKRAIYLSKERKNGYTKIITDQGILYAPTIPTKFQNELKLLGWHMLDDEYYDSDSYDHFEVIVNHLDGVIRKHYCILTFEEDDWWCPTAGALVTPYNYPVKDHACILGTGVIAWRGTTKEKILEEKSKDKKETTPQKMWIWDKSIFD